MRLWRWLRGLFSSETYEEADECRHPRAVSAAGHGAEQVKRFCPDCELEWLEES